jgi:hypothetical protein
MQRQADYFVAEKTIASFLIVPAVPAIIVACYLVLAYAPRNFSDGLPAFGMIYFLAYLIGGAHVLVLGLPAFLLGKQLHAIRWLGIIRRQWWSHLLALMAILGQSERAGKYMIASRVRIHFFHSLNYSHEKFSRVRESVPNNACTPAGRLVGPAF